MRYIFILLFLSLGLSALAQQNIVESLQRNRAGEGTVTIHQDPEITGLIGNIHTGNTTGGEQKMLKARGYRVQVYAGNNSRVARWLCRVGDFRSIEEADAAMRRLKATGVFKEVSIVREQINIPLD